MLPKMFQQTDLPLALGPKVEKLVPKKPDPIKDFETGDYTLVHSPFWDLVRQHSQEVVLFSEPHDEARAAARDEFYVFELDARRRHDVKLDRRLLGARCGVADGSSPTAEQWRVLTAHARYIVADVLKAKQKTRSPAEDADREVVMAEFREMRRQFAKRDMRYDPSEIRRAVGAPEGNVLTLGQLAQVVQNMRAAIEAYDLCD